MKKISLLFSIVFCVICFSSCGGAGEEVTTTAPSTTVESTTQVQEVVLKFDKSTLTEPESFKKIMEGYGAQIVESSEENAFEFVFSKADHDKLLSEKKNAVVSVFKDYEQDETSYIDKIEFDDNFRNLKIYVNKEKKADASNLVEQTIAYNALAYQTYIPEGKRTFVEIYYTGETERIDSFNLPVSVVVE